MSQEDEMIERDEFKPTPIKIPKVDPDREYHLMINSSDVKVSGHGYIVTLKKQEFAGVVIPHGTNIFITNGVTGDRMVKMYGTELNKILRTIFFDSLRTKKK